jgi:tetratricopeptide (TPR) repeat protein
MLTNRKPRLCWLLNKHDDALQVLETRVHLFYIRSSRSYVVYLCSIIDSLIQLRKLDKARERVDELSKLTIRFYGRESEAHGFALNSSGELLYAQNDFLNAKEVYERAIALLPEHEGR